MSQKDLVLSHLRKHKHISQRDALIDHGVQRLASRIQELRASGHNIISMHKVNKTTGQRYVRYVLIPKNDFYRGHSIA